jgi:hypothetical protein
VAENAEINHNLAKNSGRAFGCGIHASTVDDTRSDSTFTLYLSIR